MKWIGNCQLAAGCQFDFYQERRIGNCQLSACCQFDESIIRAIRNELATVNWQLAGNSISIKNFELATFSQMPFRWSYHKVTDRIWLTVANSKFFIEIELAASCQLTVANSFHISIKNFELATVSQMPFRWSYHKVYMKWIGNCQQAISIKNFELATVNCKPAANSKELP